MNEELKKLFNSKPDNVSDVFVLCALTISVLFIIKDAYEKYVKERKVIEECLKKGNNVND